MGFVMRRTSGVTAVLLIGLVVIGGGFGIYIAAKQVNVPTGYVGIMENSWTSTADVVGNGRTPYWRPFDALDPATSVKYVYVGVSTVFMGGTSAESADSSKHEYGWGAISARTGDGVGLDVDCTVSWKLDPERVLDLYQDYPQMNYMEMIIIPAVREVVRAELSLYTALEVVENRSQVVDAVVQSIETKITNLPGDSDAIVYVESHIRNIKLPTAYTQALEEKAAAEQAAIAALYQAQEIVTLAEANAEALLITAQAQANASLIQANASAQAVYIQAQSIAEAVSLLANVTGTENATEIAMMYLWIQALQVIANSTGDTTYFITFGESGIPYVYPIDPQENL